MPIKISDALKIKRKYLKKEGVFNGFIDIDSKFYIDPFLLQDVKTPELKSSYAKFNQYFKNVLLLLSKSKNEKDVFYKEAKKKLTFNENSLIALGYSINTICGKGIGPIYAKNIADTAFSIISEGIRDTIIFELIGLLEEGIGADRISDMTAYIILEDLLNFTERITNKFKIKSGNYYFNGRCYNIPHYKNKDLIFIPEEIITPLPTAYEWSDIDIICQFNESLRVKLNKLIGNTWKEATNKIKKQSLKDIILANPDLLKDLMENYNKKDINRYDFINDPLGQLSWFDYAKDFAGKYPFEHKFKNINTPESCLDFVMSICEHFASLLENNGLNEVLYFKNKLRNERFAQLLFYAISDIYCGIYNIDVSRESNAGTGALDFKFSRGYNIRINVELKYSRNSNLVKGYTEQLPRYNQAEKTQYSIYLILKTAIRNNTIKKIESIRSKALLKGNKAPELIIVDVTKKPSASKL